MFFPYLVNLQLQMYWIHFLTFLLNIEDNTCISIPRDYFKQNREQFKQGVLWGFASYFDFGYLFIYYALWKMFTFMDFFHILN